jgi:hypothetical protein
MPIAFGTPDRRLGTTFDVPLAFEVRPRNGGEALNYVLASYVRGVEEDVTRRHVTFAVRHYTARGRDTEWSGYSDTSGVPTTTQWSFYDDARVVRRTSLSCANDRLRDSVRLAFYELHA